MPNRFCAICGKDIDKSAPSFSMCLDCYLKEHPLFTLPDKFHLKVCLDCGSFTKGEKWIESSKDHDFLNTVKKALFRYLLKDFSEDIKFSIKLDRESCVFTAKDLIKACEIWIQGQSKENPQIQHQEKIRLTIEYQYCKNCLNLRGGSHFQSIIQLRVKDERNFDFLSEVLNEIEAHVENEFQRDPRQYISEIRDEKYVVDLMLSTNEIMNKIVSVLKGKYNFIMKRSKKTVGRDSQRGKDLYRLKTLIKFLPVKKGDLISFQDEEYRVEQVAKNKVMLRDPSNERIWKRFSFFFHEGIRIKDEG